MDRIQRLILENRIKDFVLIVAPERRLPEQHLVDEHTEGPPIDSTTVALLEDDLRGARDSQRESNDIEHVGSPQAP